MSKVPGWLQRERTAQQRREATYRQQFSVGRTFRFEPRDQAVANPDADAEAERVPHPRFGETVTVVRAPRLDTKSGSVRVQFEDGAELTVRPKSLKRIETDPFIRPKDAPQQAPRPGRLLNPPIQYPETPPLPTTPQALHRITQDARAEINWLAQSIHRRHFVEPKKHERPSDRPLEDLKRSQPNSSADAGSIRENWLGSYSDAMQACKAMSRGAWEEAGHYALLALRKQSDYRRASIRLEQTVVRTSVGRFFNGELLSVRHYHPCDDPRLNAAFEQWYVRLVLVWAEDGVSLTVANSAQLEAESGIEVGPDGWGDLVRWIHDLTETLDGKRRGRRMNDDRELIYLWREDEERFVLRRPIYARYPALPRAFEALRRAMHSLEELDPDELPDGRPPIGYHPPTPREEMESDKGMTDAEVIYSESIRSRPTGP